MSDDKQNEPVTIKMSRQERDQLDADAARRGMSRSELVRRAVRRQRSKDSYEDRRAAKKPSSDV